MKNIVLLGGTGFLGTLLLTKLKNEECGLKIMVHKNDVKIDAMKFEGDILLPNTLDKNLDDGDIIISMIGQTTGNVSDLINLNIGGGLNLLNSCIKKKLNKIILISSINVYGENTISPSKEDDPLKPKTSYGMIKLLTEKMYKTYSEVYGIDVTILRLSNLYGPNKKSGFITDLINSVSNDKKPLMIYDNGTQMRDLLFVEDAVYGIIQAIKISKTGFNVFNISSGQRHMIKELIEMIEKISGKKINAELNSNIVDEKCIWADNSKARKILKFNPRITIENGLKLTIDNLLSK